MSPSIEVTSLRLLKQTMLHTWDNLVSHYRYSSSRCDLVTYSSEQVEQLLFKCTTASCPFWAAQCSTVHPYRFFTLTSAAFSRSSCTTAECPFRAAQCSAVHPSSFFTLTSAPFSRSSCTTAECPFWAAQCSA